MSEHTDELARERSRIVDGVINLAMLMDSRKFTWAELLDGIDLPASTFERAEEFCFHAGNRRRGNTSDTPGETSGE